MNNFITTSKATAILSFVIGTILFVLQLYLEEETKLITIGVIFIIVAVIINSISIIGLIFYLLGYADQKVELLKACGIILLNIPIAILYFYILILYL